MTKIYKDQCGEWYGNSVLPCYLTDKQMTLNGTAVARYFLGLSSLNWSKEAISAVLGNMVDESNINPKGTQAILRNGQWVEGSAYGIVQWDPKKKLINWAKKLKQYKSYDMMYTQLQVLEYSCLNTDQWANHHGSDLYYMSFEDFRSNTSHTIPFLTRVWENSYEGAGRPNMDKRIEWAEKFHREIKWDKIFRSPIDDFLDWLKEIADNNEYLYEMGANHNVPWDNYLRLKEFDCSSYISFGLHNGGGYDLQTQFSTHTAKEELVEIGFKAIPFKNKKQCQRGDVLVRLGSPYGHTEAVYSMEGNGKLIGAHGDEGYAPANQISVIDFNDTNWKWILRSDDAPSSKPREYPTNSNKSSRRANPKTPNANTQNILPLTYLKRHRRF